MLVVRACIRSESFFVGMSQSGTRAVGSNKERRKSIAMKGTTVRSNKTQARIVLSVCVRVAGAAASAA
jgi:hypothetical protein